MTVSDTYDAEHLDINFKIIKKYFYMKFPIISIRDVKAQLQSLKQGEAPGPDQIRPELYKYLLKDNQLLNELHILLNEILINTRRMEIIKNCANKKKYKATVNELKPVALTNISYKIFIGILKCKIEDHIKDNNYINDLQTGVTKGRRVTKNIFILQYCIDKMFKDKKKLYMISIDYSKAFDSVNRSKINEIHEKFRIHPKIIDVITKIYKKKIYK